jgi:6-phosphogluconolactonase
MSLICTYPTPEDAAHACGAAILKTLRDAVEKRGTATLAVSGGTSPKLMFEFFAASDMDWNNVHIYWVDERCVPPDDPLSNFKLANDTWLERANIPAENIHRVQTEYQPEEAAARYCRELSKVARFDALHRGMGPDAHTASLFPGEPLIDDQEHYAAAVYVQKMKQWRVTMLPRVLESARHSFLLVTGADKSVPLDDVMNGPHDPLSYPAQIGAPDQRTMHWYCDAAASRLLRSKAEAWT